MPKLTTLIVFVVALLFSFASGAQILKNSTPALNVNLNSGGVVYDVDYDSFYNAYVIVGNFNSINGVTRNNFAFIDANTLAVLTYNPITSINGEIRTVEVVKNNSFNTSYIYIGGNFTSLNSQTRTYITRFSAVTDGGIVPYTLNNWNVPFAGATNGGIEGINDMLVHADSLVTVGQFYLEGPNAVLTSNIGMFGVAVFDADASSPQLKNSFQSATPLFTFSDALYSIDRLGSKYLITGSINSSQPYISLHNLNGSLSYAIPPSNLSASTGPVDDAHYFLSELDTVILANFRSGANTVDNFAGLTSSSSPSSISQSVGNYNEFAIIKKHVFALNWATNSISALRRNPISPSSAFFINPANFPTNNIDLVNNNGTLARNSAYRPLMTSGSKLFISSKDLTTVSGQARIGLAVICIEPADSKPFTSFDLSICEGNVRTYTLPKVDFANGYQWSYSGAGASYRLANSPPAAPFIPLTGNVHISDLNANSIQISFGPNTSGGILSVKPYSLCNTTTDYQFSNTQTLSLTLAPAPNLSVFDTLSLNCYSDTTAISASSSNAGATFTWEYNGSTASGNTVLVINDGMSTIVDSIYYVATVTEPLNGCKATDSTFFFVDTIAAPIPFGAFSTSPATYNCITDSMELIANVSGANVQWSTQSSNPTYLYTNPHTIYSDDTLVFWGYATYTSNGCRSQAQIMVQTDYSTAPGVLLGYPSFSGGDLVDTINCYSDSLILVADVTSPYNGIASAEWLINGTLSGDTLNLTVADSAGMNSFNLNNYTFRTTHSISGCTTDLDVLIEFDLEKPFVFESTSTPSLNCSQDSVLLTHQTTVGSVTQGWLDDLGLPTGNNQRYATTSGSYIYQVQGNQNGCLNSDTTLVTSDLTLLIDLPSDTLICPNEVISATASAINNTEVHTFLWSTGATTSTIDFTGGVDTGASVIVQTPSGCIGYDTITVSITPPVLAYTSGLTGCVGGVLQIDSVSGGAGNYSFSIDGTNWQTNSSFDNLPFGEHTILVQDDLGCVYTFIDTIDLFDAGIEMNFLASTYNALGDSIVLVNITDFSGFDSVAWIVPPAATVYFSSDSVLELNINQIGWYNISLVGHLDTCYYTFTKSVYFGDSKPDFDGNQSSLGIQSVLITPNPTTGNFSVDLALGTEQNYSLLVTNMNGQPMNGMSVTGVEKNSATPFEFPLGTPAGSYLLHVIADFDAKSYIIILN